MDRLAEALRWLLLLLNEHGGLYHITGGFAAHLYGSKRPVNDIDIDLPRATLAKLAPQVAEFAIYGPGRYRDTTWDIYLMTLKRHGQVIDLTAIEDARLANKETGEWDALVMHLDDVEMVPYAGLLLPVQNRRDLISYKSKIAYDEHKHLEDVAAVQERSRWKARPTAD
jgi:hypothetical protein